jgi:PilZ domain
MENRRRVLRQSVAGTGRGFCHVEGEAPPTRWRDCRVVDISELGVAIELHHFWPSELVGRRIFVEYPAADASANRMLEGAIRHAQDMPGAIVRLGIEFVDLAGERLSDHRLSGARSTGDM